MNDIDHRLRIVIIPHSELLVALRWRHAPLGAYLKIGSAPIPDDAEVVNVSYKDERRAFGVVLRHHSFDPVLPGHKIPIIEEVGSILLANDGRGVRQG